MKITNIFFAFLIIFGLFGCSESPSDNNAGSSIYNDKSEEPKEPDDDLIDLGWPIIKFDANSGNFEDGTTNKPQQLVMLGHKQETPLREGFMFSHWNSEKDGSGDSMTFLNSSNYANTEGTEDIMMYAQWTPLNEDFNVILEAKLPVNLKVVKNLTKGAVIDLPKQDEYKMADRTLLGWVDPDTSVLYNDKYTVEKTVTLFAVWKRNVLPDTCALVMNADGGLIDGESHTVLVTDCGPVDLPAAQRNGYILKGWQSSVGNWDGGFFYSYPGKYNFDDYATLCAIWEKE